jgi:hypothetical protein
VTVHPPIAPLALALLAGLLPLVLGTAAEASVTDWRPGGIASDPYLLALQGQRPFRPWKVSAGVYRCHAVAEAGKNGRPAARIELSFTILDDGSYRDAFTGRGAYAFSAVTGSIVFYGAALDGQRATFKQSSDPPTRNHPPSVTFVLSGDTCTLRP